MNKQAIPNSKIIIISVYSINMVHSNLTAYTLKVSLY